MNPLRQWWLRRKRAAVRREREELIREREQLIRKMHASPDITPLPVLIPYPAPRFVHDDHPTKQ